MIIAWAQLRTPPVSCGRKRLCQPFAHSAPYAPGFMLNAFGLCLASTNLLGLLICPVFDGMTGQVV